MNGKKEYEKKVTPVREMTQGDKEDLGKTLLPKPDIIIPDMSHLKTEKPNEPVDVEEKKTWDQIKIFLGPDKNCESCKGVGIIALSTGETDKCGCVLRNEARHYLTPLYTNAIYSQTFNPQRFLHKDVIIEGCQVAPFKTLIKSFLLNTGMKFSHKSVSAVDLVSLSLRPEKDAEFGECSTVDILIILLLNDPINKFYPQTIPSVIEKRNFFDKVTWLYTDLYIASDFFEKRYYKDLANYLLKIKNRDSVFWVNKINA